MTPVVDPKNIIKDAKGKHKSAKATSQSMKKVHTKYIPKQKVPSSTLESKEVLVSKDFAEKSQVEIASLENKVDDVNLSSAETISQSSFSKSEISTIAVKEKKHRF